jgi:hypothetical protein
VHASSRWHGTVVHGDLHASLAGPLVDDVAGVFIRHVDPEFCILVIAVPEGDQRGIADGMGDGRGSGGGNVFFDRIYFEEGIDKIASMLREKRATELLSEATGGKLERSLRFRELLEPLGFGHEMSGAFVDESLWGGMDLIRGAGDEDFTTREV